MKVVSTWTASHDSSYSYISHTTSRSKTFTATKNVDVFRVGEACLNPPGWSFGRCTNRTGLAVELWLSPRGRVFRALWVVLQKSTSALKWYLSATLLGPSWAHAEIPSPILICCLETTTTSCSSKWAYRPTQSISSHPKPKVQQDSKFQLLLWSISALLLSLTHSPKSFPPIPNKNSDLKDWNFWIFARRFARTWRHYCNMVIRKSAGWWRSTWVKWQVLRHERKPSVAR